jgi:1,3-beta-glucan synthase
MITDKRKKLGQPSTDKATGDDSPCAPWQGVIFSEVLSPIIMAVIFVIAYMFVKSFPVTPGRKNAPLLIRIAVVTFGSVVWNAAVLWCSS